MVARAVLAAVLVAAASVLLGGVWAQSSGCTQVLISMSPCLNYITGNTSLPSSSCCSALGSIAMSQPQCLCVILNSDPAALGLSDWSKILALGLPDECGVKTTPPLTDCAAALKTSPSSGRMAALAGRDTTGSKSMSPTMTEDDASLQGQGSAGFVVVEPTVYAEAAM